MFFEFLILVDLLAVTVKSWNDQPQSCWLGDFVTTIHSSFVLDCQGKAMDRLASCHCGWEHHGKCYKSRSIYFRSKKEDRRWKYQCNQAQVDLMGIKYECGKNVGDQRQECTCPDNMAVVRIFSMWSGKHLDRLYQVTCAKLKYDYLFSCAWDESWTPYDSYFDSYRKTSNSTDRIILAGIKSEHSGKSEDRKFKFRYCQSCSIPAWSEWSSWTRCPRCVQVPEGGTAATLRTRKCITNTPHEETDICKCQGPDRETKQCLCISAVTPSPGGAEGSLASQSHTDNFSTYSLTNSVQFEESKSVNISVYYYEYFENSDPEYDILTNISEPRVGFEVFDKLSHDDEEGITPKVIVIFLTGTLATIGIISVLLYIVYQVIKAECKPRRRDNSTLAGSETNAQN